MSPASPAAPRPRTVHSGGVRLAAWEGPANGPSVVLVHGFPDTHTVWDPVVERLSDRFHCITYDVRGAGASDRPGRRRAYAVPRLVDDLVAVLETLAPGRAVHLVGHDWGSVQAWEAVIRERSDPRLVGRLASYTTISGPCLAHVGAFARAAWRGGWGRRSEAFGQALRSWYVGFFHLPVLPELLLRRLDKIAPPTRRAMGAGHFAPTLPEDAAHGLNLYRANVFRGEAVPGGARTTLPVQLLVPLRDRFLTPAVYRDLPRFAPNLTRHDLDAGHWVQRSHPELVAQLVADFALAHPPPSTPQARA